MASKTTNSAIEALERRHTAERAALKAATDAGAVVRRAQERRAAELARLDEVVADAERGADVALAVLASLMAADVAAVLMQETPARVRLGQQRAPVEEVNARVSELSDGAPPARRRGRPRGSGRSGGGTASAGSAPVAGAASSSGGSGDPAAAGVGGAAAFSEGR
ncbi:hypothetical protein [Nucisporomicrobium flavum]|uniref:hypothetical protein n=1 Tax=Nucisporomicrobium flavum TaxID=2785915 RepID=UPI0018F575BC|nr:hypothetical protein [Nucisporomicrobium flavum]